VFQGELRGTMKVMLLKRALQFIYNFDETGSWIKVSGNYRTATAVAAV
jgi:hypothetical protein